MRDGPLVIFIFYNCEQSTMRATAQPLLATPKYSVMTLHSENKLFQVFSSFI